MTNSIPNDLQKENPKLWLQVLLALAQALWSREPGFDGDSAEAYTQKKLPDFVRHMPGFHFLFLRTSCVLFEILPLFFGFGAAFFTQLPPEARVRYFERWLDSRFGIFRDIVKTLRSVVAVFYFSSPAVWRHIDYDPHTFIAERKALRDTLLQKSQK